MKIRKNKHLTLMASLALSACTLHADQEVLELGLNAPHPISRDECCEIAPPCCENPSNRFFVSADVLYWKPHLSGLELDFGTGSIAEVIGDGLTTITTDEFDADPHFKWNAGYRLGLGYGFECSDWGVDAIWTHFQDSGSRSRNEDADTVNTTRCRVKFDQVDLVVGYRDTLGSSFNIKPYAGIRGVRIHEGLRALLVTDITISPATLATETRTFDDTQRYWGIGPVLGLQGDWCLGNGFSLYGAAAASILYGKYKVNFDDTDTFSAPISRDVFSTSTRHLHGFDCNIDLVLGLGWETDLCDSYRLSMKLAFEHHQYFNQCHLGANRGDLTFDGGVFSVGVAL